MFELHGDRAFARARKPVARPVMLIALISALFVAAGTFSPSPYGDVPRDTVTRAQAEMIVLPTPVSVLRSEPVSQQIRNPLRITDKNARSHDLGALVRHALENLGHDGGPDDKMHTLLVRTLAEGQSDAYIEAVLNSALMRGEISPPTLLLTAQGTLDTPALFAAVIAQAES